MLDVDQRWAGLSPSMSCRVASITWLTGWFLAKACSQPGHRCHGTKADEAKVKGKSTGKAASWAVSLLDAFRPMTANPQLSA